MLALTLLLACGDKDPPDSVETTVTGGTVDTGWPEDTGEEDGTDLDGDGWSVEEGDCDDDNIYVNPAREEDPTDGVDNDCDGREDEDFAGLVVVQVWYDDNPSLIHHVDTLGNIERTITLDDPAVSPYFMTWGVDGGYAVMDLNTYAVFTVDEDGTTTVLAEFIDELKEMAIVGFYGMVTHPDGYYLIACGNALYALEPDTGAKTVVASWDPDKELFPFDIAVDLLTGEVGLFGYFGGFATYDGAFNLHIPGAANGPGDKQIYSGERGDDGRWYAGAFTASGFEVLQLDETSTTWSSQLIFDQQWQPTFFTIDGDSGDYYLSANAASYPTVWRVSASSGDQTLFYESEATGSTNVTSVWDIYARY